MKRDPGLQPERTALAWQRTGLAAGMISLVMTFAALRLGVPGVAILAALVSGATGLIAIFHFPRGILGPGGQIYAWRPLIRIVLLVVLTSGLGMTIGIMRILTLF